VSTKTKQVIRGTLRSLGFDLIRWRPQSSPDAALAKLLIQHRVDTVLDIGANEGQYAHLLRELGFKGRIVSFEPLETAHRRLQKSATCDAFWTIAPRTALGNEEGNICLNVASNGASSSLLPMLAAHKRAAPHVIRTGSEIVPITRLDLAAREFLSESQRIFLKVDVQGYELQVLQGATELLSRIVGAQLELSHVPLYEGQALFPSLIEFMVRQDFSIWGMMPVLLDNSSGRLLQTDVVFFRE
jgi:FkbM family methyltransferase